MTKKKCLDWLGSELHDSSKSAIQTCGLDPSCHLRDFRWTIPFCSGINLSKTRVLILFWRAVIFRENHSPGFPFGPCAKGVPFRETIISWRVEELSRIVIAEQHSLQSKSISGKLGVRLTDFCPLGCYRPIKNINFLAKFSPNKPKQKGKSKLAQRKKNDRFKNTILQYFIQNVLIIPLIFFFKLPLGTNRF